MPATHATAVGALVGGCLTSYSPCFSGDDKLLCVPCESSVKLFSVASGEQVGCLASSPIGSDPDDERALKADGSLGGHTRTVTCVMAHPSNRVQVYTASLDGTMKLWDLYDQTCVATYPIKIAGGGGDENDSKFDRPAILHMVKGAADLVYLLVDPYMVHSIPATTASSSNPTTPASSAPSSPASAPSTTPEPTERACRIVLYQLSKQTSFILYKVKDATRLAIDPSLKLLASISGKIIRIYDTLGKRSKSTFKKQMPFNLHTVTFHPSEPYLTLGDEKGHILILYGYQNAHGKGSANDLVTQTLHWHAHKVGAVLFTQDGHYMLSGGEEGVLVIWQLETGTKQFIPRLQSNIMHIAMSHDGNTYALSMGDNRLKFVSAVSNRVEKVVSGLTYSAPAQSTGGSSYLISNPSASHTPASSSHITRRLHPTDDSSRALPIPFLYSPHHSGWFLSSVSPGSLQLYDIFQDKSLADMDLLQRNIVSRMEDEISNQPRLESMAISPLGDKMVTTERRSGNVAAGSSGISSTQGNTNNADTIVMKFWDWHSHSSSWVLNTRIDPPHSHASSHLALSTLLWHPNPAEKMVVTIGKDACFKIWREIKKVAGPNVRKEKQAKAAKSDKSDDENEDMEDDSEEECYWNCTGVGHYRSYPTSSGAFSSDGSLLAVSYGQVLTLWDPYTLTLKHTLLHPSPNHPIRFVSFLPNTPFLLTTTATAMYVWNLLTLSLWWSYDLRVISYAVHERVEHALGYFAVMVLSPEEEDAKPEQRTEEKQDEQVDGELTVRKPFKRRQTHLLLFSVHSPVPLRVWPLRDARLDSISFPNVANPGNKSHHTTSAFTSPILFAQDPLIERTNKRDGASSTTASSTSQDSSSKPNPTSLVYVNYKRQLVRFDDIFNEEPKTKNTNQQPFNPTSVESASAAAMARLVSQNAEISLFEQLYGKAYRPVPRGTTPAPSAATVGQPATIPGHSNLASLLNGPSHILPPPSSLFSAIMDGMIKKNIKPMSNKNESSTESQSNSNPQSTDTDEMDDSKDDSTSHVPPTTSTLALSELDAQLLSADSLSTGEHFVWDSHPTLAQQFTSLVAMIHDPQTKLVDEVIPAAAASNSKKSSTSTSHVASSKDSLTADRKRKKASSKSDEKEYDDQSMVHVDESKSAKSKSSTKKSPKLAPVIANGTSDAMEIDEDEATHTNGHKPKHSSKHGKNKH